MPFRRSGNRKFHRTAMLALCAAAGFLPMGIRAQQASNDTSALAGVKSLIQQNRLEEAKGELQAQLRTNPSSAEAYDLLGIIDTEQQDYPDALPAFQRALQLAPRSPSIRNNLANLYTAEKKFDLAEDTYRSTLRIDPANRDANYNLGVLLVARNQPQAAIEYFDRVRPADQATQFNLIKACLAAKRTAEALRMATQLSAGSKSDVRVHFSLGMLLASAGQYKQAELELEQADELQPETFEILYNLGVTFLLDHDNNRAELQLSRALRLRPDSPETLVALAQVYRSESRPLDALDLLVRAHKAVPGNTDIVLRMAQISMSQGYFEDAIPLLESAIQTAPQQPDLHLALGQSYLRSDRLEKAVAEFTRTITLQPSLRAYSFLGLADAELGRFDAAVQDFQNGLKFDPRSTFCLFNLGYIAERQGHAAAAEAYFLKVLRLDPKSPNALEELAGLRMDANRPVEAEALLKRYVEVSRDPATGYYKLAMVERKLHQPAAAERDLALFQSSSAHARPVTYDYENLFDYLENRSTLSPGAQNEKDLAILLDQRRKHPDQPEVVYLLAQTYLRSGDIDEARSMIGQLDAMRAGDYRTLAGAGVLLARYHLYDDAVRQFQAALAQSPDSDDVKFDLADAWFRKGDDHRALDAAQQVSAKGQNDESYLALLADIEAHLGRASQAEETYRQAISRSPDNDQNYLSLALVQLREGDTAEARETLLHGQARIPASGKILWGLGVDAVMVGNDSEAEKEFERALDLLPEWPGSYSLLGVFYFETGEVARAREVLDRFKNSSAAGGLDVNRIEQTLASAPAGQGGDKSPLPAVKRAQILQIATALVDQTL